MRSGMRRLVLAAAVLALVAAAPAVAKEPPAKSIFLKLETPQSKARTHSCAKEGSQKKVKLPGSPAFRDQAHKAVVACEQPPRSQPLVTGLEPAQIAALFALVG
jgi:hypothetical protein